MEMDFCYLQGPCLLLCCSPAILNMAAESSAGTIQPADGESKNVEDQAQSPGLEAVNIISIHNPLVRAQFCGTAWFQGRLLTEVCWVPRRKIKWVWWAYCIICISWVHLPSPLVARWLYHFQVSHLITMAEGRKEAVSFFGCLLWMRTLFPEAPQQTVPHFLLTISCCPYLHISLEGEWDSSLTCLLLELGREETSSEAQSCLYTWIPKNFRVLLECRRGKCCWLHKHHCLVCVFCVLQRD